MNKSVKLNSVFRRSILFVIGLLCVVGVYFAINWYLANLIANVSEQKDMAEAAVKMSPRDPRTHYTLAAISENSFLPADLLKAPAEYEKAVSLSPDDFRLWFDLGRARERTGDSAGAEKALRKALELAPHYSRIHWTLGNLLLRRGNTEEAFAEFRKSVENDPDYANPAVNIVWQFFNGDVSLISQKIGDSNPIRSAMAAFLVKQKRFDEALNLWNNLPENEKKSVYLENGKAIIGSLIENKRFRDALSIQQQIDPPGAEKFEISKFSNGGFESNISSNSLAVFGWKIDDGTLPQVGFDDQQKHGENRSLVILFNSPTGKEFRNIQQMIAVEGGKHYVFEGFARADLKSSASLKWEIVDMTDGKVLASTAAIPNTSDWLPLSAEFTTPGTSQAVNIRLARIPCSASICPITGKAWFDDFSLRKSE